MDPASQPARQFAEAEQRFRRQQEVLAEAQRATAAWRTKLPVAEVPVAVEQAKAFDQSLFAWLRPAWWRLRRILNDSYDFRSHVVHPRWSQVLDALQKEYQELDKLDRQRKTIAEQFRLEGDIDGLIAHVQQLRQVIPGLAPWLGRIHTALVKAAKAPQIVAKVVDADEPLRSLAAELDKIMHQHADSPLDQLRSELKRAQAALGDLPAFLQCLNEIAALPPALGTALCMLPLKPSQIEAATADRSLADAYHKERQLANFNGSIRDRHAGRLERLYGQWLASNASELRSRVKQRFLGNVRLAGLPAAQLRDEEKDLKKRYIRAGIPPA